ncbi:MFS family permease [Nonomuraea muscovyensis]|uniref:MFS family permease n=1 Tax=Nonomuraea muscovyensis TaxID=1124761 RepID=A0A7X0C8X9_9ACTN|nr:MFS transporter [Nonomuraea muscovyensis]MBB6349665.1 MFS family permease [Nonomuraea muscovyensis]
MSTQIARPATVLRAAPFLGFAGFGTFWGVWGASLPLLRTQAEVSDAEFGIALLFVAAGALPAMLLTGRLIDALGLRVAGVLLALLGVMGLVVSVTSATYAALCAGILLAGASSGASDVAINTLAATVEKRTGRPIVARSHAAFSATVAVSSLGAGALTGLADSLLANFAAAAVVTVALGLAVIAATRSVPAQDAVVPKSQDAPTHAGRALRWIALLMIGAVGALAFASENAYQSWCAVLLTDEFAASSPLAAVAPAAFATTAALARFAAATITFRRPIVTLASGSVIATTGGVLTAFAPTLPLALVGIVTAAAGTSILFPTLLSYGLRPIPDESRGRATSAISTVAYVGYLAGPAFFGLLADATGVQQAFLGIAALTAVLLATIPVLSALKRAADVRSPDETPYSIRTRPARTHRTPEP